MSGHGCQVLVFGEVLCDLFSDVPGIPLSDARHLVPALGGAPANVAVQLARLGVEVELLSAVGDDPLGVRVIRELEKEGVGVRFLRTRMGRRTGLTLIEVDRDGERRFHPFRENAADQSMRVSDLPQELIAATDILHHGTVSLRSDASREATLAAQSVARQANTLISLDVNLRFRMFPSKRMLLGFALDATRGADIVKATREEAELLLGRRQGADLDDLIDGLHQLGPRLVFLTLDRDGAVLSAPHARVHVPAPVVDVRDATGAGDAFMGGALAKLLKLDAPLKKLDRTHLLKIGRVACHCGAEAVTAMGATGGLPKGEAHLDV